MHSVRYTGQEFEILWAGYGRDRLPYPLQYRPDIDGFDELKKFREAAVESLLGKYAVEVERAIDVLLEPDVRVEAKGFGGRDASEVYRFHGAIRGQAGVALVQMPGAAPDTGGDVMLSYCGAREVAQLTVASLPKRGPGSNPPLEVRREELAADSERHVRRAYEVSLVEQLNRVFKRDRLGLGEIGIFPGPALDARPAPGRGFWWMDYEDGRYYVKTGNPIVAKPVDAERMAAEIHRLATLTQRYYREDREHEEYLRSR
ncbi:ESX secretion-associated protein EspG [Nocardia transvalensis]|uniref:ESX secretion-associated protein EspG n=1 Tax=Nocardia transvalensis TaxID=37333 RepID=UPI00189465EA|nr:ESX secretion-associated protein EspG [Nocardia transvalensis]MBF6330497.1 ESX secretion-associated protein EspG [Nocardia transvalensis]